MPPLIKHLWDCEFDEVASKITADSHTEFVDTLIDLLTEAQMHEDDADVIAEIIDHALWEYRKAVTSPAPQEPRQAEAQTRRARCRGSRRAERAQRT